MQKDLCVQTRLLFKDFRDTLYHYGLILCYMSLEVNWKVRQPKYVEANLFSNYLMVTELTIFCSKYSSKVCVHAPRILIINLFIFCGEGEGLDGQLINSEKGGGVTWQDSSLTSLQRKWPLRCPLKSKETEKMVRMLQLMKWTEDWEVNWLLHTWTCSSDLFYHCYILNERHWSAKPSAQQCMWLYLCVD